MKPPTRDVLATHPFRQPELRAHLVLRERLAEEVEDNLVGEPLVVRLGGGIGPLLLGEDAQRPWALQRHVAGVGLLLERQLLARA